MGVGVGVLNVGEHEEAPRFNCSRDRVKKWSVTDRLSWPLFKLLLIRLWSN